MFLTIRRWVGHSTLSSPDLVGRGDYHATSWLLGLMLLMMAAIIVQGPSRFLSGIISWPSFQKLMRSSLARLRKRPIVPLVLIGCLLLSWTTSQIFSYSGPGGLDDLQLTLRTKTLWTYSLEQGFLSAIIPLRDLANLADNWVIVLIATVSAFYYTNSMQWVPVSTMSAAQRQAYIKSQYFWFAGGFWLIYRIIVGAASEGGLPLISGVFFETVVEPAVMIGIDAMILAWVVVELRDSQTLEPLDMKPRMSEIVQLLPAILLVNILVLPARYFVHIVWILWNNLLQTVNLKSIYYNQAVESFVWFLGDGFIYLQVVAFPLILVSGAVAFSSGSIRKMMKLVVGMLRFGGDKIVLLAGCLGMVNLAGVTALNLLLISHPQEPWVLIASDSYCHYFTFLTGMILMSGLIEIASEANLEMEAELLEKQIVDATDLSDKMKTV